MKATALVIALGIALIVTMGPDPASAQSIEIRECGDDYAVTRYNSDGTVKGTWKKQLSAQGTIYTAGKTWTLVEGSPDRFVSDGEVLQVSPCDATLGVEVRQFQPQVPGTQRQVQGTQTSTVLVGNSGKTAAGNLGLNRDRAQAFTTGSNAAGYKLTSVDIASPANSAVGNWDASIASDGGSGPGSTVTGGALTEPSSLTTGINNSFTSTNGVDLDPSTTYYIVIDMGAEHTATLSSTTDDTEDANPAAGWSIEDGSYTRMVSNTAWNSLGTHNLKIRVNGYAKVVPVLSSAKVNGTSLVLTFDSNLDTTSKPVASRFTISEDGGPARAATAISISGMEVRLTVPAVTEGRSVTVSYSKPTSNPLKGATGADVAAFTAQAVTNNTPPAPALTSAQINGTSLFLNFDKDLDTGSGTAAGRFTIEAGGSSHAATAISISVRQVRLTVPAVRSGQFVTVSYSKPASNPLKGSNGVDVLTLLRQPVTNNTPGGTGSGTVRAPITYTENGVTREVTAFSADRLTLWDYFESECTRLRSVSDPYRDYSLRDADGHLIQARNGWKYVYVQNSQGDVTGTRSMTISECASNKLYQRQSFCAHYADRQGPNRENICPTNRAW